MDPRFSQLSHSPCMISFTVMATNNTKTLITFYVFLFLVQISLELRSPLVMMQAPHARHVHKKRATLSSNLQLPPHPSQFLPPRLPKTSLSAHLAASSSLTLPSLLFQTISDSKLSNLPGTSLWWPSQEYWVLEWLPGTMGSRNWKAFRTGSCPAACPPRTTTLLHASRFSSFLFL